MHETSQLDLAFSMETIYPMELLDERQRRLTTDEYRAMAAAGILRPGDRVELIDGLIVTMSPIGWPHANIVLALTELLSRAGDYKVSVQNPLGLDRYNEPQPDLALLRGDRDPAGPIDAGQAVLVVEVADSSISFDRRVKLPRYAKAGIQMVWIVDVAGREIDVYRGPEGDRYVEHAVAHIGDELELPGGTRIAVGDVFPS